MSDIDSVIIDLDSEIKQLQLDLAALQRARAVLERRHFSQPNPPLEQKSRTGRTVKRSAVHRAEKVLREASGGMHVDDILKGMSAAGMKKLPTKASLSSTLARYAKKGKLFKRTDKPNTFELLLPRRQPVLEGERPTL